MVRFVSAGMTACLLLGAFSFPQALAQGSNDTAIYRVEIENTWSPATHPGAFPRRAHFSWLGGGIHNDSVTFWRNNELASPGVVLMAETGVTTQMADEVRDQVDQGQALSVIDINHWFCPEATTDRGCGETTFEIEATPEFAFLTLATMLGPSPDWFVGVDSLPLRSDGAWLSQIDVTLFPYDGGTRSDNVWLLGGTRNAPPEPITLITEESGQLVGPDLLGYLRLTRIIAGDFDQNGQRDAADIDLLSEEVRLGNNDAQFDLNADALVNQDDRIHWVEQLEMTSFGDSNLDGRFNSSDLVAILAMGEFQDSVAANSTWASGDWNGDQEFTSSDLILAFQRNGFESAAASRPDSPGPGQTTPVPEPAAIVLMALGLLLMRSRFRGVSQSP